MNFAPCITHTQLGHTQGPVPTLPAVGWGLHSCPRDPALQNRTGAAQTPPPRPLRAPPFLLHSLGRGTQVTRGPSPCSRSTSGCAAPHFQGPQPSAPGLPADAGRRAHGAVGGGGRGSRRSRAEALACIHEAGRCGRSFGEGRGGQAAEVRRGAWREGGGGEGGKRRQARGAAPGRGGHCVPGLLLADAVEDLTCVQRLSSRPRPRHPPAGLWGSLKTFTNIFA